MLEHLLERISVSKYKDTFVLKGGMLIASMVGIDNRTTMDMDATLRGYPLSDETIRAMFSEICAIPLEDEVTLTLDHILPIREEDEYGGYRLAIGARYESINTPLKIDITTGDVITRELFVMNFIQSSRISESKSGLTISKRYWLKKWKPFYGEVCSIPARGIFTMSLSL